MSNRFIVVLVDYVGRRIIGEAISDTALPIIKVKNPLILKEVVDQTNKSVHLSISPIFHTFEVTEKEIKWTTKFIADEDLSSSYDQFVERIRAKRNTNIEVVGQMPTPQVIG